MRPQAQQGGPLARIVITANRNLQAYEAMGVPVWPDVLADHPGPLAGFLTGLQRCETPYLVTVPCDSPLLPLDLVQRLADALTGTGAQIAVACAPETRADGQSALRPQPVFCLMPVQLRESLAGFTRAGGRKAGEWTSLHKTAWVPFDQLHDDPRGFVNANTLAELRSLERA